ncbi:DMT family transporter [Paenibacillus sp. AR247]|uniref:DMT family transporter n=1 Tax=Paenibacillus sp. AR247 TaxID=1631599 RepID=UPI0026B72223|nr:DMT family transporter [Paenibacillus sp. AR247]
MKPFKANVVIMIVTLFWGSSYLFMKMGLDSVQPFNLIALRFGLAFIAAGGLFAGRLRRNTDASVLKHAALLGFILFGVFASIMLGLQGTSTSNAGFLMSLTVIFVPVLSAVFGKSMPSKRLVLGVLLAMTGIGLLTLRPQSGIGFGDLWCILGALLFAVHMMLTGRAAKTSRDPLCIGIWQLGFAGAFGLVFTVLWETPRLPGSISGWVRCWRSASCAARLALRPHFCAGAGRGRHLRPAVHERNTVRPRICRRRTRSARRSPI